MRKKTNNKQKQKLCDKLATTYWLGPDYNEEV